MKFLTIGERITYDRTLLGWSKKELATAAGVSPSAVTLWEQGDTKGLKPDNLVAAARALEVTTDWLAVGKGPMKDEKPTPEEQEVLGGLRAMDRDEREAYLLLLRRRNAVPANSERPKNDTKTAKTA